MPTDRMRSVRELGAPLVATAACVLALLALTDLIPAAGRWYTDHPLHRLQSSALLEGRLAWAQEPQWDGVWGATGIHTNFGLGIPLISVPLDAVARAAGSLAFPDRLRFLLLLAVAVFVLARGLDAARRAGASAPTGVWGAMGAAAVAVLFPAFVRLCNSRFVVYEETIAVACLWALLLLGLLLDFAATGRPRTLAVLALCAGFALLIRPTALAYGTAAVGLALVVGHRDRIPRQTLVVASLPCLLGPVVFVVTNGLRFGSPFRVGVSNIVSSPLVNYVSRFETTFARVDWWSASRELFGALFLLPEAPPVDPYDNHQGWLAPVSRWREFYGQPFDVGTLVVVLAALGLAVFVAMRPGKSGRAAWFRTPAMLLLLWGAGCSAALFAFYARLPYLCSRYLVEFAPPLAAIVLGGCWTLARRLEAYPGLMRWLALTAFVAAFSWIATRDYGRVPTDEYGLRVVTAEEARAHDPAERSTPFVAPPRHDCGDSRPLPPWARIGWQRDCGLEHSLLVALAESACIEVSFSPRRVPGAGDLFAAAEALRVRQDFDELPRCRLEPARAVYCRRGESTTAPRDGARLVVLAFVPARDSPEIAARSLAVTSVRTVPHSACD